MWWNKKTELPTDELHIGVFTEIATWYKVERLLDQEKQENSLLFNLETFNIGSLTSKEGLKQIDSLFAPKVNSFTVLRMRDLLVNLYAKFGTEAIDGLIARTLHGMMIAHKIPMSTLLGLQKREPIFWLLPFCGMCHRLNLPSTITRASSLQH